MRMRPLVGAVADVLGGPDARRCVRRASRFRIRVLTGHRAEGFGYFAVWPTASAAAVTDSTLDAFGVNSFASALISPASPTQLAWDQSWTPISQAFAHSILSLTISEHFGPARVHIFDEIYNDRL
jgi:hypothetical protein